MELNLSIFEETGWTDSEGSDCDSDDEEVSTEFKRILAVIQTPHRHENEPKEAFLKQLVAPTIEDTTTHLGSEMPTQGLLALQDMSPLKDIPGVKHVP